MVERRCAITVTVFPYLHYTITTEAGFTASVCYNKSMDHIRITGLFFRGKHGVGGDERNVEQEFLIEADLSFDAKKAGLSDKITDTLDYSGVRNKIRAVIEGPSRYLIEALAEDIAGKILEDKRIKSTEVTIKKTAVWKNGVPSITITRSNT